MVSQVIWYIETVFLFDRFNENIFNATHKKIYYN